MIKLNFIHTFNRCKAVKRSLSLVIVNGNYTNPIIITMKKALKETQTLHAGCSKLEPKNFAALQTPFPGGGTGGPKFNQLEMVTTFTYKPSLVKIDARNFELSW